MFKLFHLLNKKSTTEAYKRGYSLGLSVGLDLGKSMAADQPAIVGINNKMQRDIEDILRNKNF
jgi:uncharacterized protein YebE (UPF0316 family)